LHVDDPLGSVIKKYQYIKYASEVFVVHWLDGLDDFLALDKKKPYLEIGTL